MSEGAGDRSRRLFFAVDPPEQARADLRRALAPLQGAPGEPHWTAPDRWHLTLLFLGTVPDARLPDVLAAAGPALAGTPPMSLRLAGGGRFGSLRRPQVVWVGLDGDVAALIELAERLRAAVRGLDLPVEDRPFRAHLTLGRWRAGRPADGTLSQRLTGYRGPAWPVAEVRLMESHLGRDARYEAVATWPVG
ncbi:MAG: RNA 2',3'-cyclic phosphodiesterase [Blastococcus sp.]